MSAVFNREALAQQAKVDLVDQGGALQCVLATLMAQMKSSQFMQFAIDQGNEGVERLGVSLSPSNQELRDSFGRSR